MDDQEFLKWTPSRLFFNFFLFFEDDLRSNLFAVSLALMEKFANNSENFKLELVPSEQKIINNEWLEDTTKKRTAAR